jgi:hypothetical protein
MTKEQRYKKLGRLNSVNLKRLWGTPEYREKMILAHKGKVVPEETKRKISKTAKSRGIGRWMIGKKHSSETKKKISESNKGKHQFWLGKKASLETRKKCSEAHKGEKSYSWKGGVTSKNEIIRKSMEYRDWRLAVFQRDNYTCRNCKGRGVTLHADHIKPFAYYPELRLVIENGRTLCVPCHKKTDTYGHKARKCDHIIEPNDD